MSEKFKSGFISIIGRPNVGKSTLLNSLIGTKVSIVSNIPQTTRFQVRGVLNLKNAQIVFVDTPGMHSYKEKLASHLNTVAKRSIDGIEGIMYVMDVSRKPGKEEKDIMKFILGTDLPVIMVFNKIDLGEKYKKAYIELWNELLKTYDKKDPVVSTVSVSAINGKNIEELIDELVKILPEGHPFYDKNTKTDFPLKFRISDIIREKLFSHLREELPHSIAVEVEEIEDRGNFYYINAVIYVTRESQKPIVIGKSGSLIKKIGSEAREEIEAIMGKKVFLDIFVRVEKDWQNSTRILKELGYWWA